MNIIALNTLVSIKDEGSGPVIIMLHGWGQSVATFDNLAHALAEKYRVIRIDFPGFGASPMPPFDWSVRDYAELVQAVMIKRGVSSIYAVVGHSFGGRVIIKGLHEHIFDADKVVLMGAAGAKPKPSVRSMLTTVIAKTGKRILSLPGLNIFQTRLQFRFRKAVGASDYQNAGAMKQIFVNTIKEDLLPLTHSVSQPTLMLWGEDDHETPVRDAQAMKKNIPHAELVVIKNAGHFVYHDAEQEVTARLKAFLG